MGSKKRPRVEWLWADDSGKRGKSQDLWKPFKDNVGQKIETAWAAKKTEVPTARPQAHTKPVDHAHLLVQVKVDKERFVDMSDREDIWQVR